MYTSTTHTSIAYETARLALRRLRHLQAKFSAYRWTLPRSVAIGCNLLVWLKANHRHAGCRPCNESRPRDLATLPWQYPDQRLDRAARSHRHEIRLDTQRLVQRRRHDIFTRSDKSSSRRSSTPFIRPAEGEESQRCQVRATRTTRLSSVAGTSSSSLWWQRGACVAFRRLRHLRANFSPGGPHGRRFCHTLRRLQVLTSDERFERHDR